MPIASLSPYPRDPTTVAEVPPQSTLEHSRQIWVPLTRDAAVPAEPTYLPSVVGSELAVRAAPHRVAECVSWEETKASVARQVRRVLLKVPILDFVIVVNLFGACEEGVRVAEGRAHGAAGLGEAEKISIREV